MINIKRDGYIGIFAILMALTLLLYLIPEYVVRPQAVRNIVLSPVFWPTVIAWMMLLVGGGILVSQYLDRHSEKSEKSCSKTAIVGIRVIMFFVFLAAYYLLIPVLGMVWSSSLAFIVFSIVICGTEYRKTAIVMGLLLPISLYVFFYHVAGVNIPQNELLRLP